MDIDQFDADVIVIGSGVAGAMAAARLAAAGLRVLILEAGPETDRTAAVARMHQNLWPYESTEWAPQPTEGDPTGYLLQDGPVHWGSDYERRVGGTTWHWLGNCPRLLPSDFEMKTRFGIALDWPIGYDDLEPWYVQAEAELGIAGDSETDAGSPRSAPYPLPPLPLSTGDLLFREAAAKLGYEVVATPQARNSVDGYQGRSICCGNGTCIPVCPVQAKYDATVHVKLAVASGAELRPNAVVSRLDVDADGAISGVRYLSPDGAETIVTARRYLVAANGIETPKLLLNSVGEYSPAGVANSSDQVGRNLADHPATWTSAVLPAVYAGSRGPMQLAGIDSTREGDFRSERSAFRFEIGHSVGNPLHIAHDLINKGRLGGRELFAQFRAIAPFQVGVASLTEQLPNPENRVTADPDQVDALGIPRPRIAYAYDEYTQTGLDSARDFHRELLESMGATDIFDSPPYGVGHLMGTCRMGADPKTSVTDDTGLTHDHPNLYLAGSSLFPTTGTANPTLTLAALALRTADAIATTLGAAIPTATPIASPVS